MRIETLSIRRVTIVIFLMIALVAVVLSILAGGYFKKAAMNAQMNSLSRVIEVASQQMLKEVKQYTFDLAMKLAHSDELTRPGRQLEQSSAHTLLLDALDDPFVNGFVGVSQISLQKIRVYGLDLALLAESREGVAGLEQALPETLIKDIVRRKGVDRLKAVDALWMSNKGPMLSTIVPLGGLRQIGYLEVVVNPVVNLPLIGEITRTPISIYNMHGQSLGTEEHQFSSDRYLPIEFILTTSDGQPAFRIIGYEDVARLNRAMDRTQLVTITGFLVLSIFTLAFALWLFNRFLFVPLKQMMTDMHKVTRGNLDLDVNKKGLMEFHVLAEAFNAMTDQVRIRTGDLEYLLDLDESGILCFSEDNETVYFNRRALDIFGYTADEISDMDMEDFFVDDIAKLLMSGEKEPSAKLRSRLAARLKGGAIANCDAVISEIRISSRPGYAITLTIAAEDSSPTISEDIVTSIEQSEQRMVAIEQSLSSLLEMAQKDPLVISGLGQAADIDSHALDKTGLRETAVLVMQDSLACWEHELSKTKLDLAEQSKIWPVYIDKSTPTTRTLDKYLNLESCPKNPRCQRVVDTAEFVLRQLPSSPSQYKQKLISSLDRLRQSMAGI